MRIEEYDEIRESTGFEHHLRVREGPWSPGGAHKVFTTVYGCVTD